MSWTDERIDKLKALWEQGVTASQIAESLGEGVSRNAVIGKAHRLGLQSRPSPVKATEAAEAPAPVSAPVKAAAPQPVTPKAERPVVEAAAAQPQQPQRLLRPGTPTGPVPPSGPPAPPRRAVPAKPSKEIEGKTTLLELSDKICKWPIGHPGEPDFHFCGKQANPGFPYCTEHCAVAYQAQLPRRDRRPPPPPPYGAPRVR